MKLARKTTGWIYFKNFYLAEKTLTEWFVVNEVYSEVSIVANFIMKYRVKDE